MIRIILSGHSDLVATLRATAVAHQYLAKPCDPDDLRGSIQRTARLRRELGDERIAAAIGGTQTLPPVPGVLDRLTGELTKEEPDIKVVGDIVASDPALTAKVLQLVNSAFFSLRREITSIHQAVTLLGMKTVAGLTLSVGLFETPQLTPEAAELLSAVRDRSLDAANIARAIALAEGGSSADGDAAFLAGIVHDCGKLVMSLNWPEEFVRCERTNPSIDDELEALGLDHARAGGYLLGVWGLPDEIVEAVTFHHEPGRSRADRFDTTAILHAALALMNGTDGSPTYGLDADYLEELGKLNRLDAWAELVEAHEYEKANA